MKRSVFMSTFITIGGSLLFCRLLPKPLKSLVLGNLPIFSPKRVTLNVQSPLYEKRIGFLGSSITYGAAALGNSFVDYLQAKDGVIVNKSAISGTTLAGFSPKTYVSRLQTDFNLNSRFDAFVCQLSTNDGRAHKEIGQISDTDSYDCDTTIGAIEFICHYVKNNFNCPLVFYICVRKSDDNYNMLIDKLYELQKKWNFTIIDLKANPVVKQLNKVNEMAMADDAHPTQLGYQKIWTPIFENELIKLLSEH